MEISTNEQKIYDYLVNKYNKAVLTRTQLTYEMDISRSTMDKFIINNENIPPYKKLGNSKNSRVIFNIADVAKFLNETIKTTM